MPWPHPFLTLFPRGLALPPDPSFSGSNFIPAAKLGKCSPEALPAPTMVFIHPFIHFLRYLMETLPCSWRVCAGSELRKGRPPTPELQWHHLQADSYSGPNAPRRIPLPPPGCTHHGTESCISSGKRMRLKQVLYQFSLQCTCPALVTNRSKNQHCYHLHCHRLSPE